MSKTSEILKSETKPSDMNIGLSDKYRKDTAKTLSDILSSTYRLMITSHIYHWNVVGPLFKPLHELTEAHYNDLFAATDVIAERVRALGHLAPATFSDVSSFSPSKQSVNNTQAGDMVHDLIALHETVVRKIRKTARKAGDAGDMVTEDMLTARLTFHEQALWMLRSVIS
ncbi:Dps family protein [Cohaesibacter celericrescens]|uniref:DNA starvation/stationary phase protection protein n=1 Tax=Cohaesibacter celericrescens TaxID=2067669 RepID=A0A2N5XS78_9HYPH|nr:DNA starvation/stationary phase protection protein [Cohaesibacter celericrescens]PLW77344.1 DNA starvation/stationary phase protection protein [Cohaesibacter celericrescens]